DELINIWRRLNSAEIRREPGARARLAQRIANHPLQFQILREIQMQLEHLMAHAKSHNQGTIAEELQKRLASVNNLFSRERLKKEGKTLPDPSTFEADRVYKIIRETVGWFD